MLQKKRTLRKKNKNPEEQNIYLQSYPCDGKQMNDYCYILKIILKL